MILKDTATFQVLFNSFLSSVLGISLPWRSTVAFTYLKVKSAKCLCLLPVVLVLRMWSCLHYWSIPPALFGASSLSLSLSLSLTSHVIQWLMQSLSCFHSTCTNHLSLLFSIIKLTKEFSEFFTFLSFIQLNPTHPSDHTHFSVIQLQFMLYFHRSGLTAMQALTTYNKLKWAAATICPAPLLPMGAKAPCTAEQTAK